MVQRLHARKADPVRRFGRNSSSSEGRRRESGRVHACPTHHGADPAGGRKNGDAGKLTDEVPLFVGSLRELPAGHPVFLEGEGGRRRHHAPRGRVPDHARDAEVAARPRHARDPIRFADSPAGMEIPAARNATLQPIWSQKICPGIIP